MRIVVIAPGSRGDLQPYLSLASGLQKAGHTVRLVTNETYAALVASHGVELCPVPVGIQGIVEDDRTREVLERGSLISSMVHMARQMKTGSRLLAERSLEAARGGDLVIAGIAGCFVGLSVAEKLGLRFLQAYNVPLTPTRHIPGALFPAMPGGPGGSLRLLAHRVTRQVVWQAYRPADSIVRKETLGLTPYPPFGPFRSAAFRSDPVLYGFSPSVLPPPPDWDPALIHVTGYWFLDEPSGWAPPPPLERFLEAGPAPIYVGFGSMSSREPEATARIVLSALERAGQRGVVFSGWGGLRSSSLPASVCMVDSVPHSWLFARVAAVVHHGGAGTTAAGLRAGVPSVVVPFHGDQPFWGRLVAELGVGPAPLPRKRLDAEALGRAMRATLEDGAMRDRAAELGGRIRREEGVARAVELIEEIGAGRPER